MVSTSDSVLLVFVSHTQDHQKFLKLLTETEDWLYEEGEDQAKQAYVDKLEELMVDSSPSESSAYILTKRLYEKY